MARPQVIFIEAGHGKSNWLPWRNDPGAVNGTFTERELTVRIARKVSSILKNKAADIGSPFIADVGVNTEANIDAKIKYIRQVVDQNRFNPRRCFGVSIHINSFVNDKAEGFEVWSASEGWQIAVKQRSLDFGSDIYKAMKKYRLFEMRRGNAIPTSEHFKKRLYIDSAGCPFVLLECGFISNEKDLKTVASNTPRVAEAIAHGILNHFR